MLATLLCRHVVRWTGRESMSAGEQGYSCQACHCKRSRFGLWDRGDQGFSVCSVRGCLARQPVARSVESTTNVTATRLRVRESRSETFRLTLTPHYYLQCVSSASRRSSPSLSLWFASSTAQFPGLRLRQKPYRCPIINHTLAQWSSASRTENPVTVPPPTPPGLYVGGTESHG